MSTVEVLLGFATTLALCRYSFAVGVCLTPTSDQTIPLNSFDNITYDCTITDDRLLFWEVSGTSIEDGFVRSQFEGIGVFVENQGANQSTLIITRQARQAYSNEPIPVRCSAFTSNPPRSDFSGFSSVISYGVPDSPRNLMLTASGTDLTLSWLPPTNVPPGVLVTYCVEITSMAVSNRTCNITTTWFTFPEDNQGTCEMFQFTVTATNPAGDSTPTTIRDTIPISPDVNAASQDLTIDYINLPSGDEVFIQVSFPPARTCSDRFPVTNYSVNVLGLGSVTVDNSGSSRVVIPVNTTDLTGFVQEGKYSLTISACIEITCRESLESTTVYTTSVQSASITFFETNVLLTCTFVNQTPALGCVISLILANASEPEQFFLSRNGTGTRQCNTTQNRENAYTVLEAVDWESDQTQGSFPVPIEPLELEDASNFTTITQCPLPGPAPAPGLSGGQIAGIVIAVVAAVVIIVTVIIVIGVVFYKQRTGPWAKIKHEDKENLAMDFDPRVVVGEDSKPKRTWSLSRRKETSTLGEATEEPKSKEEKSLASPTSPEKSLVSPGSPEKSLASPGSPEKSLALHSPVHVSGSPTSPPPGARGAGLPSQYSLGSAIDGQDLHSNEPPAFVLHISDQTKKARLQLNKEAIRRAIRRHAQAKKVISSLQSKTKAGSRPKRMKSMDSIREFRLPMNSIVSVVMDDVEDHADLDDQEVTLI